MPSRSALRLSILLSLSGAAAHAAPDPASPPRDASYAADSLRADLSRCLGILRAMDVEMEIFSLDSIHPQLAELYRRYDRMIAFAQGADSGGSAYGTAELRKVKARTETIHRLFDAGEAAVSQGQLRDLIRHATAFQGRLAASAGKVSAGKPSGKAGP